MPDGYPDVHLVEGHDEGCGARREVQEGGWETPWFLPSRRQIKRHEDAHTRFDSAGRRMGDRGGAGHMTWEVFLCNSRECSAWGIYDREAVCEWIEDTITAQAEADDQEDE